MNSYLIESLAPLVFRSGKPFGSISSAQDVIFPLPSAAAGLVRALAIGQGQLSMDNKRLNARTMQTDAQYKKVLSTPSQGPFLVRYNDNYDVEILVPKPANALYLEKESGNGKIATQLVRLVPEAFPEKAQGLCGSDLPTGLLPVKLQEAIKGKPKHGATYWLLDDLIRWQQGESLTLEDVNQNGISELPIDIRTHVSIDDKTLGSEEGKLFQTASFDLAHQHNPKYFEERQEQQNTWSNHRFGFLVQSQQKLKNDLATFGGERRLSHFKSVSLPSIHDDDGREQRLEKLKEKKGFCLTFLTPVIFKQGYLPNWIDDKTMKGKIPDTEISVQLKAVAADRWQGVSGWDSILWKPKATRKAICAGSVYWFELINPEILSVEILEKLEQQPWSEHQQDQCDGFGSALLTAWQG